MDKELGDNFAPLIVLGVMGLASSLNAPEDDTPLTTPFEDATQIGKEYAQSVRDEPAELANGFDNAGAVAELLGVAMIKGKTPQEKAIGTALTTTGLVFGAAKEYLDPSSPNETATNAQIDFFTKPLPGVIEVPTQLILKKVNEKMSENE